jgi:pentatricopeptide repeat protein
MQCCNKSPHFVASELRDYLRLHPRQRSIGLVNDVLDPLARRLDDSPLVDLIVGMLPSVNITRDARTYEILLTMHAAKQNAAKAKEVMEEMRVSGISFTPCALAAVLTMALQLNNLDMSLKAFTKLKASWDVRSTWAVSPFALQRHKARLLAQLVELACREHKLCEVIPLLKDMNLPGEAEMMMQQAQHEVKSDASTSEGSRSDTEDGEDDSCSGDFHAPPGLPPPESFIK